MDRKRVLVIGGGGFIGRHVVAGLAAAQQEVVVLDLAQRENAPGTWISGSLQDPALVASAVAGCDAVVFLANASLPGSSHADLAGEVNAHVGATVRTAEICSSLGVTHFVFASSGGTVYGVSPPVGEGLREDSFTCPRNAYGVSKLAVENYLRVMALHRPMRTLSLRISNPYGEGQRAHRAQGIIAAAMEHAVSDKALPIWGDGSVERDFIYVGDVAQAFVAAIQYQGNHSVMNIGSGESHSIRDVLSLVEEAVEFPLKINYEPNRSIDVDRNRLDITLAKSELGWMPAVGLKEGLHRTAVWWRAQREAI